MDSIGGIPFGNVLNLKNFYPFLESLVCPICLKIIFRRKKCLMCNTSCCEDCLYFLNENGTKCPNPNCLPNKRKEDEEEIIQKIFEKLILKCPHCGKSDIPYVLLEKHLLEECKEYNENEKCPLKIMEKIMKTNEQIEKLKLDQLLTKRNIVQLKNFLSPEETEKVVKYIKEDKVENLDKLRQKYLEKDKAKDITNVLIGNKPWNLLHYACWMGSEKMIGYLLKIHSENGILDLLFNLKDDDINTPIEILIGSDKISLKKKRDIIIKYGNIFQLKIRDSEFERMREIGMDVEALEDALDYCP